MDRAAEAGLQRATHTHFSKNGGSGGGKVLPQPTPLMAWGVMG